MYLKMEEEANFETWCNSYCLYVQIPRIFSPLHLLKERNGSRHRNVVCFHSWRGKSVIRR